MTFLLLCTDTSMKSLSICYISINYGATARVREAELREKGYICKDFDDISIHKIIMTTTLILTLILVGLAVILLGVRVFFVKGGEFPKTEIEDQPALRAKGIVCGNKITAEADKHKDLYDRINPDDRSEE